MDRGRDTSEKAAFTGLITRLLVGCSGLRLMGSEAAFFIQGHAGDLVTNSPVDRSRIFRFNLRPDNEKPGC
jgi:hypothetical protein